MAGTITTYINGKPVLLKERFKCIDCGETKEKEQFSYFIVKRRSRRCKRCKSIHTTESQKRREECLRESCKESVRYSHVDLICPVCKKEFKRSTKAYSKNKRREQTCLCSRECRNIFISKKWQQNQSDYAIKIKKLLKEY